MSKNPTWKEYACEECEAKRVKLWRGFRGAVVNLLCKKCAEKRSSGTLNLTSNEIGWYVPACAKCASVNGNIYYNTTEIYPHSSIPKDVLDWWNSLAYDDNNTPIENRDSKVVKKDNDTLTNKILNIFK
jgi:hypothetical protein